MMRSERKLIWNRDTGKDLQMLDAAETENLAPTFAELN